MLILLLLEVKHDITRLKNAANEIINLEHSSTFNQKVKEGSNYAKL